MQTWLDWYTRGARERWNNLRRTVPELCLPEIADDYAAMGAISRFVGEVALLTGAFQPKGVAPTPTLEHLMVFDALLLPFFRPAHAPDAPPSARSMALAPSRALVAWLAGADAPEDGGEAERLLAQQCLYVDLPDGALLVGGWCARAMLTMANGSAATPVALVMTRRGGNRAVAILEWVTGRWNAPQGTAIVDIDAVEACRQAEAFLKLLVLYNSVADADRRDEIPQMPAAQMRANPRRAAQRAKKYSLFRVQTLDAPREAADRVRVPGHHTGSGHRLDVRVAVRPHFRWQAYGPRWGQRKLILIHGFWRGPEDGRVQAPIVRLDAPHPRRTPWAAERQPTAARRDAHGVRDSNASDRRRVMRLTPNLPGMAAAHDTAYSDDRDERDSQDGGTGTVPAVVLSRDQSCKSE